MKSGESRGPLLYQDQTLGDGTGQRTELAFRHGHRLLGMDISIQADYYGNYQRHNLTRGITFKARQVSRDQPGPEPQILPSVFFKQQRT